MTVPFSQAARDAAVRLLRQVENFRADPYQDSGGKWTIGYGSILLADGSPITADTPPITIAQANALLLPEMNAKANAVDAAAPAGAPDCQLTALYSFTYNEGVTAFRNSTLLKLWIAGDIQGTAGQFPAWVYCRGVKLNGLVNRRRLERAVFLALTPI